MTPSKAAMKAAGEIILYQARRKALHPTALLNEYSIAELIDAACKPLVEAAAKVEGGAIRWSRSDKVRSDDVDALRTALAEFRQEDNGRG